MAIVKEREGQPNSIVPVDEQLRQLSEDELASFASVPSVDLKKYSKSPHLKDFFGQGFTEGLIQQTMTTPTTLTALYGKMDDEQLQPGEKSYKTKVAEKLRNVELAARKKLNLTPETRLQPQNFGEGAAEAVGNGVSSIAAMLVARVAGGAAGAFAGGKIAGPAGAVAGAEVAAPVAQFAQDYASEKATLAQELMDAGYSARFVDNVSSAYALPVASLDFVSLNILGKFFRPTMLKAATAAIERNIAKSIGTIGLGALKGLAVEGGTEGVQQGIQYGFEVANKLRDPNLKDFLAETGMASFVGMVIGGSAATVGQLSVRRDAIKEVTEKYGVPKKLAVQIVDETLLRSHDGGLDGLAEQADIHQEMAWVDKAFAKIEGTQSLQETQITEAVPTGEEYAASKDLLNAEPILIEAKAKELQTEVRTIQKERSNLMQQAADLTQQKRLVKIDAQKDFLAEMGRAPQEGELGPWVLKRVAALETRITELNQKLEGYQNKEFDKRGQLFKAIEKAPQRQEIEDLHKALEQAYTLQTELMSKVPESPDPKWQDAVDKVNRRIEAISLRLENLGTRQETIAAAEAAVDENLDKISATEGNISEVQNELFELRKNPELAFSLENKRAPKGEVELKEWVAKKQEAIQNKIQDLQTEADMLTQDVVEKQSLVEDFRSEKLRVEGAVSMRASQVRQMALKSLRDVVNGFKAGRKFAFEEVKTVQKAFLTMIKGVKLSQKATKTLLRKVLSIRTADQFNKRIGDVVDAVNTVIRTEKVRGYQQLGKDIIAKMLPAERKVSPQTQLFAERLRDVMSGKVPASLDINASDPVELSKAIVEHAVEDLHNAGQDEMQARRSLETIRSFFKDGLQQYADFKLEQKQEQQRLAKLVLQAVTKKTSIDPVKQALDSSRRRQKEEGIVNGNLLPLPYTTSFFTVLDILDMNAGAKSETGPLFTEFHPGKPYLKWIDLTHEARDNIDNKLKEIYGKNAYVAWKNHIIEPFVDVVLESGETQNISRSAAMSLYMLSKMPRVREDLLDMGISEAWLTSFESGQNEFTAQDHAWMENVRQVLDGYAEKIAPLYEKLTGKPFRAIDNYFMVMRYMYRANEEAAPADEQSIVEAMFSGFFDRADVSDSDRLKKRTGSQEPIQLPDIYEALTSYARDMNHFLSYAEYVDKLQKTFQKNSQVRKEMAANLSMGMTEIIDEHIRNLADGGISRGDYRKSMRGFFRLFGYFGRNQLVSPKQFFRQFSALAAFTQIKAGKTWIGAVELAQAGFDLPNAFKTGEIKEFLDTPYMKERHAGLYDFGSKFAGDMARREGYDALRTKGVVAKIRETMASEQMHFLLTASVRYGDRASSLIGGWAVYRTVLAQTNNVDAAKAAAIEAIEVTQQSQDPSRAPVAFSKKDFANRLMTVFMRTPAIYLDTYLRTWGAYLSGRMDFGTFSRRMATYHIWIPLFEVLVTAGQFEPQETLVAMMAGPFSYSIVLGQFVQSMAAAVVGGLSDEDDLPWYLKDAEDKTLYGSFTSKALKAVKKLVAAWEYPDYEEMWGAIKAAGAVADVTPIPAGYLTRALESIPAFFTDPLRGLKILGGYPESRTKEE